MCWSLTKILLNSWPPVLVPNDRLSEHKLSMFFSSKNQSHYFLLLFLMLPLGVCIYPGSPQHWTGCLKSETDFTAYLQESWRYQCLLYFPAFPSKDKRTLRIRVTRNQHYSRDCYAPGILNQLNHLVLWKTQCEKYYYPHFAHGKSKEREL